MEKSSVEVVRARIKRIAQQYEKKGYSVSVEPNAAALPEFLKGLHPDLLARSPEENVVVEVKTSRELNRSGDLTSLAIAIQSQPNWRFELVVIKPKGRRLLKREKPSLDVTSIRKRLDEVRKLVRLKSLDAAFLLLWSTLEAALKLKALEASVRIENENPLALMKTIYSYGLLSRSDLHSLEESFDVRSALVHGFQTRTVDRKRIDKLLSFVESIVSAS